MSMRPTGPAAAAAHWHALQLLYCAAALLCPTSAQPVLPKFSRDTLGAASAALPNASLRPQRQRELDLIDTDIVYNISATDSLLD